MDISTLLSTKERVRLLSYLLSNPSQLIFPDRIAKKVGVSRSQAHKYIGILRKQGLLDGKMLRETPLLQSIRTLLNIKKIEDADLDGILRRHFPKMRGWGVFGSFASGTNSEGSDLDLWVRLDTEPEDLQSAKAKKEISEKLAVPVDIVAATPRRLEGLRQKSDAFYYSLYNGKLMGGEEL